MIKTIYSIILVIAQITLVAQIAGNKSPEDILKILLIAVLPFSKEPLIRLAEEREKQLKLKNKESQG